MAKMERGLTLEGLRGNVPAAKLEAGDVARVVVPEEDDKYKVLSPRYKPTKKRNKSKKSKRSKNSGGGPLADEEFTQPASSQTKHADEKKEEAAQEDRGTHSTPIDAVVRFLITSLPFFFLNIIIIRIILTKIFIYSLKVLRNLYYI
jgi:hypothetical protein